MSPEDERLVRLIKRAEADEENAVHYDRHGLTDARDDCTEKAADVRAIIASAEAAEASLAKAVEALQTLSGFAGHDNDCKSNTGDACDCGYSAASREALQQIEKGGK